MSICTATKHKRKQKRKHTHTQRCAHRCTQYEIHVSSASPRLFVVEVQMRSTLGDALHRAAPRCAETLGTIGTMGLRGCIRGMLVHTQIYIYIYITNAKGVQIVRRAQTVPGFSWIFMEVIQEVIQILSQIPKVATA